MPVPSTLRFYNRIILKQKRFAHSKIVFEANGPIATITINRPAVKNAIDRETADQLSHAFRTFEDDDRFKVGVLMGAEGTFCAGADLKSIAKGGSYANRLEECGDAPLGPSRLFLKKPVIAAISGYAVAGGLELALLCDLRVVEEDAVLGVFCRKWGVPLIDGGTVRLPKLIGLSRALDLILTGRPVSASEALEIGLANRVVPKGHARQAAEQLAHEIASYPTECMLCDRESVIRNAYDSNSVEEGLKYEFRKGKEIALRRRQECASRCSKGRDN